MTINRCNVAELLFKLDELSYVYVQLNTITVGSRAAAALAVMDRVSKPVKLPSGHTTPLLSIVGSDGAEQTRFRCAVSTPSPGLRR